MQSIRLNYPPEYGHGGYLGWIDDHRKKFPRRRLLDSLDATSLGSFLFVDFPRPLWIIICDLHDGRR